MSIETPRPANKPGALDGIRVLELSALIAGPSCARFLADHGADVIKLERFPDGDVARHSFAKINLGRGPMFTQHNAGKRGICVDLKSPEGIDIARRLIAEVDVVVEAFTPGVMERLGLGYTAAKELNPSVIYCSVSGFGQTGPNANRPGYAHVAHATSGWLAVQFLHRDPPESPRGPGVAIGDTTTGLTAFGAVCAALFKRERTGEGEHIDIALFDSLFCSNDVAYQHTIQSGGDVDVWYHPVHQTLDGFVTANVGPDFRAWKNVCTAMDRTDLLADPRFDTQSHLMAHIDAAAEIVSAWMATLPSADAESLLTAHHIPCAQVLTVDEAVQQPQVVQRELTVALADPVHGDTQTMNSAFRYANSRSGVGGPAPTLGQHNAEVLREVLGCSEAEIGALSAAGVLQQGSN